ncbi:nitrilase-related carbon-nitrogen hydrolase [Psychrobacter sp. I-STPA10]|uniref:nitrilase-related carbon-nitrogen hydrolase n=1 Tax=Psychrobacter sp. I-STPA10 TaxID=2585769 RepID=UPI001E3A1972|nr:nitrilase-related carbon-nitrogen hydrolase [Psychrobacter sp. I-STPA10]
MHPTHLPIIACVQLNSQSNIDTNLHHIQQAIATAKQQGADVVVLPENALCMGNQFALAEQFEHRAQQLANLASQYQLHLLAGTLPCPYRPDGSSIADGRLRQSSLLFAPDGKQIARYDKIHLFCATVDDTHGSYNEAKTFEAGETTVVARCEIKQQVVNIGLMVCFDLRFAALAQQLRHAGAQILTAPAAFTYKTGEAHWRTLLQARALDAQCMVIGAAQGGRHIYPNKNGLEDSKNKYRDTWGHASIANANGEIIACYDDSQLNGNEQDSYALIYASFDNDIQQQWRKNMPLFNSHRLA